MKIDELMVGDWYYWEAEGKLYPYQVKPEDFVKGEIPNFQPIPLTPDILRKNWFMEESNQGDEEITFYYILTKEEMDKFSRYEECCAEEDFDYIIRLFVSFDKITESDPEISFMDCCISFPINYVHDLQHFMKNFGLDKRITII